MVRACEDQSAYTQTYIIVHFIKIIKFYKRALFCVLCHNILLRTTNIHVIVIAYLQVPHGIYCHCDEARPRGVKPEGVASSQ